MREGEKRKNERERGGMMRRRWTEGAGRRSGRNKEGVEDGWESVIGGEEIKEN